MTSITTRAGKGSPLTHNEVDGNFTNLNNDKLDTAGIALGSAASPTLKFTGDTNTGIYSPGADQLAVSTGGTGRLFVDASGNVGVGTPSDGKRVFIYGDGTSTATLGVVNPSSTNGAFLYLGDSFGDAAIKTIPAASTTSLAFFVAGASTERLRIDSSGRVGIGTSSPGAALHVIGSTTVTSQANVAAKIGSNTDSDVLIGSINGNAPFIASQGAYPLLFLTNATERARITSAGNVGIGTIAGTGKLEVAVSGNRTIGDQWDNKSILIGTPGAFSGNLGLSFDTTNGATIESAAPGVASYPVRIAGSEIQLFTASTERVRIDSSGRLLVGTSSVKTTADVKQEIVNGGLGISRYVNDAFTNALTFTKSRGASNGTIVQSGDQLGPIEWLADDGTSTPKSAALIDCYVDGTPGANDMPGRLVFSTTADGASSPTERMRITSAGTINFSNVAVYADNAAAITGGLAAGDVYRTSTGQLMIRY